MLIEAVIFDLDGTLIQLPVDYEKLFREFKDIMKTSEVRPLVDTVPRLNEETMKKVFKAWDNHEILALKKMTVKDEGIKIYEMHQQKPKALVTMQGKALVEAALRHLGLTFNVIVTREDSLSRIEQLKSAVEELGMRFQSVLFVGNTEDDFIAAKKLNCRFLRVK